MHKAIRTIRVVLICSLFAIAEGDTQQRILQLEREQAEAAQKGGTAMVAWLKQNEADTCTSTDGDGHLQGKEDDVRDAKSGSFTFRPEKVRQSRVRVYGDVAVYTGLIQGRGNENGKEFVGYSRITDTWVKLKGKWQLVATHNSQVSPYELHQLDKIDN